MTRGGVCQYFLKKYNFKTNNNSFIAQCIICEITLQNSKGYVAVTYRSPSQFEEILSNFDSLLNHIKQFRPSFTIILGNFSARSKSWWPEDVTSYEGIHIESLSTTHGLQQLTSDPTHLLPNSPSFTDLIFTNQPNLVVNNDIHSSVHAKCHH